MHPKAIEYTAHGYSVIPIKPLSKLPLLNSWKRYQSEIVNEQTLSEWFEDKDVNIAIVTGKVSELTVVDIDDLHATPLTTFPETYTVQTPSGGYHLYYLYNEKAPQSANSFSQFPHTDIRNDGGYVVAPPSKTDKGVYTIVKNIPLALFPIHLFGEKNTKISVNKVLKGFPKMADGDGRNDALTRVTGKLLNMVDASDYESVAYPILVSANKMFQKPLLEHEVRTIFDSISKRQLSKPGAEIELLRNDKGIIPNEENVYRTIIHDEGTRDCFRYNIFVGSFEIKFQSSEWKVMERVDVINVRMYLMKMYQHFVRIPHASVEDAIIRYGHERKVSPPVEYFKSLTWDKVPRLNEWLTTTYNVDSNEYHRAVGSNWVKGMVKRLVHPGSKFDYVLVLEGKQGIKKSTSLAVLGQSWHVETIFTPDSKDFFMLFSGKAIVEFSEGETLSRTEAKHLKAVITMQYDKYRPPYERSAKDFPRQCVFAMTTNQTEYLKDETGNRRWLPVACKGMVNVEWLKENRDQLFAEAYHRVVTLNETVYEFPEDATREEQEKREIIDPREHQVFDWYYHKLGDLEREQGITTRMAFEGAILKGASQSFTGKEMSKLDEMVIGSILRERMKLDRQRVMIDGARMYKYYLTEESKKFVKAPQTISADEVFEKWPL